MYLCNDPEYSGLYHSCNVSLTLDSVYISFPREGTPAANSPDVDGVVGLHLGQPDVGVLGGEGDGVVHARLPLGLHQRRVQLVIGQLPGVGELKELLLGTSSISMKLICINHKLGLGSPIPIRKGV